MASTEATKKIIKKILKDENEDVVQRFLTALLTEPTGFYTINYEDSLLTWRGFIILSDPNNTYVMKDGTMIEILWPNSEKSFHKITCEEKLKTIKTMVSDRISKCYDIYIDIEHHGIHQKTLINSLEGIKIRIV